MKSLIWKECLENIKWVPLPALAILVVFFINKPTTAMPDLTHAFYYAIIAGVFGAALGFVQIYFDGHGDKRSLLLHRPLRPTRIFLAKACTGVGLYVLALGIPFVGLESWLAAPARIGAPYHWRTSLPWLADILSGVAYYFAGMLAAQRDVRWYGSKGLAVAAAFFCSFLVWALPEFWQATVAIGISAGFMSVAAWGSFCAGGAYTSQPRLARTALAVTSLVALVVLSVIAKQLVGELTCSGIEWEYNLDRHGRLLRAPFSEGRGQIGPWIDLATQRPFELEGKVVDSRGLAFAPWTTAGGPSLAETYRNSGRFYVPFYNGWPDDEMWFYDQVQQRLVGYDPILHFCVGSFGPDGFTSPGTPPGERFQGELCYQRFRWQGETQSLLAFPAGVYSLDFHRRSIRKFFVPAVGEVVTSAGWWKDVHTGRRVIVVSTNHSIHFLKDESSLLATIPKHNQVQTVTHVGLLEKPTRYFVWYLPQPWLVEPQEFRAAPSDLYLYDSAGHELYHQTVPPPDYPVASHAQALFGLATSMSEAATLVEATWNLRSQASLHASSEKPVLLDYLENSRFYIPGTGWYEATPEALIPAYLVLILLSATTSAIFCFWLTRCHALSVVGSVRWSLVGFFFGWVGVALMLAIREWPGRTVCPNCRRQRVVTQEECEHCGAGHALPVPDGTEIFQQQKAMPQPVVANCEVTR